MGGGSNRNLIERYLTKRELIVLLELIQRAVRLRTEAEFRELVDDLGALFDYQFAVSGLAHKGKNGEILSCDAVTLSYPDEWIETYVLNRFDRVDPVFRVSFTDFKLTYWADAYRKYPPPARFVEVATDFGLCDGYVHGVKSTDGLGGSAFSFAASSLKRERRTELILEILVPHLHEALLRVLKGRTVSGKRALLSQREREVLQWIAKGKSTWEISLILHISENTVKFHIKNILRKLNTTTRTHAVAVAVRDGLIDIE